MIAQILVPIVFLLISTGVYFGLTDPIIRGDGVFGGQTNITELRSEKLALARALRDADKLKERAAELNEKVKSIPADQIKRLDDFLPDSVDDLQLVVDINNIASRSEMKIGDVELGGKNERRRTGDTEVEGAVLPEVATVPVTFTVTGSYANFKAFLTDIAQSLRILEVKEIEFASVGEGSTDTGYRYQVTVETYWLK